MRKQTDITNKNPHLDYYGCCHDVSVNSSDLVDMRHLMIIVFFCLYDASSCSFLLRVYNFTN